jgi:hypothetical protein
LHWYTFVHECLLALVVESLCTELDVINVCVCHRHGASSVFVPSSELLQAVQYYQVYRINTYTVNTLPRKLWKGWETSK